MAPSGLLHRLVAFGSVDSWGLVPFSGCFGYQNPWDTNRLFQSNSPLASPSLVISVLLQKQIPCVSPGGCGAHWCFAEVFNRGFCFVFPAFVVLHQPTGSPICSWPTSIPLKWLRFRHGLPWGKLFSFHCFEPRVLQEQGLARKRYSAVIAKTFSCHFTQNSCTSPLGDTKPAVSGACNFIRSNLLGLLLPRQIKGDLLQGQSSEGDQQRAAPQRIFCYTQVGWSQRVSPCARHKQTLLLILSPVLWDALVPFLRVWHEPVTAVLEWSTE